MWIELSGMWACEKVPRRVTHAQGVCLGSSAPVQQTATPTSAYTAIQRRAASDQNWLYPVQPSSPKMEIAGFITDSQSSE